MTIRSRAVASLRWRIGSLALVQLVVAISGLVLIRLLQPVDFGLMASASLLIMFSLRVNEAGVTAAIVQRPSIDRDFLRRMFGAVIVWNGSLAALVFLTAPAVAHWFQETQLAWIIRVLTLQLVFDMFAVVPAAEVARRIDFRGLSIIDVWAAVAGSLVGIVAAALGADVWALVSGALCTSLTRTIALLLFVGHVGWPSWRLLALLTELRLSALVIATTAVSFTNQKVDVLIVGRTLGAAVLGTFTVAVDLAKFPTRAFMPAVTRVMFPVYTNLQDDIRAARSAFQQSVVLLSMMLFPFYLGLAVVADDLVYLLFGENWTSSATLLLILCLVMPVRTVERLLPAVSRGFGREDITMRNALTTLCLLVLFLVVGTFWGAIGVAVGWATATLFASGLNAHRTLRLLHLRVGDLLVVMVPSALGAAIMCLAVIVLLTAIDDQASAGARLALSALLGVAVYGAWVLAFQRQTLTAAFDLVVPALRRRPDQSGGPI